MKKSKRYNPTLGKLVFILPAAILIIVVLYAYVQLNSPGTLIVTAETPQGHQLQVAATVDGKTGRTPWTLHLTQGNYVVNFTTIDWYHPPTSRDVAISPGLTAYAVAVYSPIGRVVQVTPGGFNATTVTALHGVTQVNFTNPTGSPVTFTGSPFGTISLEPGQTVNYTFGGPGTYTCNIPSTNDTVTIKVS